MLISHTQRFRRVIGLRWETENSECIYFRRGAPKTRRQCPKTPHLNNDRSKLLITMLISIPFALCVYDYRVKLLSVCYQYCLFVIMTVFFETIIDKAAKTLSASTGKYNSSRYGTWTHKSIHGLESAIRRRVGLELPIRI